jgi:hypothetical protein
VQGVFFLGTKTWVRGLTRASSTPRFLDGEGDEAVAPEEKRWQAQDERGGSVRTRHGAPLKTSVAKTMGHHLKHQWLKLVSL